MNEGMLRLAYGFDVRAMAEDKRSVDVVASTSAIDSYGEIVLQDWNLDRYKKNPVVLFGHNAYDLPIGHASNVRVEDGRLVATLNLVDERANPMAERVYQGIRQGSLRAVSVGFVSRSVQSIEVNGKSALALAGNELIEISVVPVPANPEAVALQARAFNDQLRALVARSTTTTENAMLKNLLPILSLDATANEADATKAVESLADNLRSLMAVTGAKSASEAVGLVQAWKASHARVAELEAQVAEAAKTAEKAERATIIAKARAEKKLAPALLAWAESCPLESLKAFVDAAPAIPQLAEVHEQPQVASAVDLKFQGKGWDELTPMQKHALHQTNHALYVAMRDAARAA